MRIAVCVATYRRPVMLGALLDSLAGLRLEHAAPQVTVVVVENELNGTAAEAIAERRDRYPFALMFDVEPIRNIALARNRCVAMALADGADWIAFVDDDEVASPQWLQELLDVQRRTGAEVVAGPVVNRYDAGTPDWITASGFPVRKRHPTGATVHDAETSNVLVAHRVFDVVPGFDEQFGLSGGSDSHFFLRARRAGVAMTWADEAVVYETLPASRAAPSWLLRRAFRHGNAAVFIDAAAVRRARVVPRRLAWGLYHIAKGVGLLPAAAVRGRAARIAALQELSMGAGAISALAGYRYVEYKRTHGA